MPKHFPEHFKVRVEGLNEWVVGGISVTLYLLLGSDTAPGNLLRERSIRRTLSAFGGLTEFWPEFRAVLPPYAFAPEVVIRTNLPVLLASGAVPEWQQNPAA